MILARVDGYATCAHGHKSLKGQKLIICTPVDETRKDSGEPFMAIDPIGAARHQFVLITTDGSWTQATVKDDTSPVRNEVIGIVD